MTSLAPLVEPLGESAARLRGRMMPLLAVALACALAALLFSDGMIRLLLMSAAATLAFTVVLIRGSAWWLDGRRQGQTALLHTLVSDDASPCFATDTDGQVLYRNKAAETRFGRGDGVTLIATLGDVFAHPSAVLYRLQSRAANLGAAREDVVTRRGHVRLSVHRTGPSQFLWRLEEMLDRNAQGRGGEAVSLPMLVASKSGTILFMNEALRRLVGGRPRSLDRVFTELPLRSGETAVISGLDGPVRALVAEIEGATERREIYLLPGSAMSVPSSSALDGFETLPVALMRIAPGGTVLAANRIARDMMGITEDQHLGLSDLVEGLGRSVRDWLSDVIAGRLPPGKAEVLRLRRPGAEVFVQIALRPLTDDAHTGVIAVISDATAMKTLEAQFVQSQKMQAIGHLAGGVAHDFNNLLTAISGHCDLLLLRHDRTDPDYADLVQIHQNANRAAALVGQLLAFSRKQTLKAERIDLSEVLADITHLLNRLVGEKVTLDLAPASDVGPIRADRRQLEQVLMNLVVNARDAMPGGGTIRIETEPCALTESLRRNRAVVPPGDYALVRVIDEGTGIAPDLLERIFEPFYTTKRTGEGTGLGLSTAYGIVKQTGGFIFVDSKLGQGTVFTLYFPINSTEDSPVAATSVPAPRAQARQGQGVVLLVEDEAPLRAFAARALRLRGYTVIEAENAEEALERLSDPALAVDVFVTDVIMPGMDGPSWVRHALKERPGVRVVFVSGYAEDSFADAQAEIPNSVFLPKPFSLDDLTSTVQGQLH